MVVFDLRPATGRLKRRRPKLFENHRCSYHVPCQWARLGLASDVMPEECRAARFA
jgi:hypothetical protein